MSQKQMSQGCFPGLLQAGGATALPCALPPVPKEHRTRVCLPCLCHVSRRVLP